MSKYTGNVRGNSLTQGGSGAWSIFRQSELRRINKWSGITTAGEGGNVQDGVDVSIGSTTWKYHTFTEPGPFIAGVDLADADILLVAGGGPGGFTINSPSSVGNYGGGGGAGGVVYAKNITISTGEYNVTVGLGGSSLANGQDSSFYSIGVSQNLLLAKGGGTGGETSPAQNGGSGGGGSQTYPNAGTTIQSAIPQSYPSIPLNRGTDGTGFVPTPAGGGDGGGASGTDKNGTLITPNYLEFYGTTIGIPQLNPTNSTFGGGGGGGGSYNSPVIYYGGGAGGGGNGYSYFNTGNPDAPAPTQYRPATNALDYSGGGGGGGGGYNSAPEYRGTDGARGVVVIRYVVS
jgi:hypothetical protein